MRDPVSILDKAIQERALLKHPFYLRWSRGELTIEALQDYAIQYYHHVWAFPGYLSLLHSRSQDSEVRMALARNLMDEEGQNPTHPQLWLDFIKGLGVDEARIDKSVAYPETALLIKTFQRCCGEGDIAGLSALYAYESQIPEVAKVKMEGLQRFYGIDHPTTLTYFQVHSWMDVEHADAERNLIKDRLNAETLPIARRSTEEATKALYHFLDGICRRSGLDEVVC